MGRRREERWRLIDELLEQGGYSRRHAIKLLGAKTGWGGATGIRKRRPRKNVLQAAMLALFLPRADV